MIELTTAQIVGLLSAFGLVVSAGVYVGRLSQKVTEHDKDISEIKQMVGRIDDHIRNGFATGPGH